MGLVALRLFDTCVERQLTHRWAQRAFQIVHWEYDVSALETS